MDHTINAHKVLIGEFECEKTT